VPGADPGVASTSESEATPNVSGVSTASRGPTHAATVLAAIAPRRMDMRPVELRFVINVMVVGISLQGSMEKWNSRRWIEK
jgi:hypothetical protein